MSRDRPDAGPLQAAAQEGLRDPTSRGPAASLRDLADRIAAQTLDVPWTDSTELLREDRLR